MLPVTLYGLETWSLTLRENRVCGEYLEGGEDCIMRGFINRTLYQMLLGWSNRGWDRRDVRHISATRISMGKSEGRRPLGRRKRRWEDNIKIGLTEIGLEVVDWMQD